MIKRNSKGQFIKGYYHTEKWKKRHSQRMSGKNNPFYGKKHSQETIRKMSKAKEDFIPWNKGLKIQEISGKNHWNWKGGKTVKGNRVFILKPNHPNVNMRGYIRRSHLVAEKYIGRYIIKEEQIHHIDGNSLNDNPENLYVFFSNSAHWKFHRLKNKPILKSNLFNSMPQKNNAINT